MKETIFAPATAAGKAGVAVIRISGPEAGKVCTRLCGMDKLPTPRKAIFTPIKAADGAVIDNGLLLWFPNPASFTGEDVIELQVHGGRAVIFSILAELSKIEGFRPADRGEFTRRAVENCKMDLTAAEGLADLIEAETEQQRKQALRQMNGALATLYERWSHDLKHVLAWMEAYIDFPEEEVPASVSDDVRTKIKGIESEIGKHLDDGHRGERLRDGFRITIIGAPNAGKSSLMNRLAQRDVAIVSSIAGTTRDVIEVRLDINGYPVVIADTAGLRDTNEEIEAEGIRRAYARAEEADLVLAVIDASDETSEIDKARVSAEKTVTVINKIDRVQNSPLGDIRLSAKTGEGIDNLLQKIQGIVENVMSLREEPSLTRLRHRQALEECREYLAASLQAPALELMAEDLRMATRSLGKITGQVEVEELLDIIFKDFCIGK